MFENKTLVGIGCSHVYGSYEGDYNIASCHERSWVNKLEKLGNFKSSINLGLEGGSNDRSVRELINFLKNNSADSLVVIFSITELSRTEFQISNNNQKCVSHWTLKDEAFIADIKKKEFLETYYNYFQNDNYDKKIINQQILMLHTLLKSLNIEHYFFNMINLLDGIEKIQFGIQIPFIDLLFKGVNQNVYSFLRYNKFPIGTCQHFDHDANQFLAEHIYKQIKEQYYG